MAEFMIAVLIVSLLWVMWDVIKLALKERYREEQGRRSWEPKRQQMKAYAESFYQLADTFQRLPGEKEYDIREKKKEILEEVWEKLCINCSDRWDCWEAKREARWRDAGRILELLEEQGGISAPEELELLRECSRESLFLESIREGSRVARLNRMWSSRLRENREAVASQLYGTAAILEVAASLSEEVPMRDQELERQLEVRLRMQGILLGDMWSGRGEGHMVEVYLKLRTTRKGRCISVREVAGVVSSVYNCRMVPHGDSRTIVNGEYATVHFLSEPDFLMTTGAARVTMEGEPVSGDNFSMFCRENGQMIMSLSDGMGSGAEACLESETVIELLEQFLEAGFAKEMALRMIHATMTVAGTRQRFTTVDLCITDLYTGNCELLKVGASTTFIRRGDRVEAFASTSLPLGMAGKLDFECVKKKLEPGDFIVMVSDGVLDALPHRSGEKIMQEILLDQKTKNAQEMAGNILTQTLVYRKCQAADDMTVLVGGFWKR